MEEKVCMACFPVFLSPVALGVSFDAYYGVAVAVFVDFPLFSGFPIRASCEKSCRGLKLSFSHLFSGVLASLSRV